MRAVFNWFEGSTSRAPYFDYVLIMEEHTGTHCDAPAHMIPPPECSHLPHSGVQASRTVDTFDVSMTMGPANVIDVTHLVGTAPVGVSPMITKQMVLDWESAHGDIASGDVVLFYTGWTDLYYKPFPEGYKLDVDCRFWAPFWERERTIGWPAPEVETMQYLVSKGVKHVGTDTPSMGSIQDDGGPHWVWLKKELMLVEKLTNLGSLPPRGAYYIFLPLKIKGATGAPGRAIAIV